MPNDCPFQSRLSAFFDHELDAASATEVQSHVGNCPSCAQDLHSIEDIRQLILQAPVKPISQMGMARLHATADSAAARRTVFPMARFMMAAAASILIISGAWLVELPAVQPPAQRVINGSADKASEWWESVASGEGEIGQAVAPPTGMASVDEKRLHFSNWMLTETAP